jgi:prepilin-type N-terminal cleavage/methylation domain-containing protein
VIRRRAFTLLEIIVAVAVFSLTLTVLYSFGSQTTKSWGKIRRSQHQFGELMALDRTFDNMLTNAIPFLWPAPDKNVAGQETLVFAGRSDSLLLATLHRVSQEKTEGAIRFVHLSVQDGELLARYAPRPFWDWDEVSDLGTVSVLAKGVDHVFFQYADFSPDPSDEWGQRLEWTTEWDTDEDNPREEIPLAIMVTVVWQDGRTESWLRRTAGTAYRERFGKWNTRKE